MGNDTELKIGQKLGAVEMQDGTKYQPGFNCQEIKITEFNETMWLKVTLISGGFDLINITSISRIKI